MTRSAARTRSATLGSVLALEVLSDAETNFLGVDRGADALRYSLPYYITFNIELADVTMGVWSQDISRYSGNLVKTGNGEATVMPANYLHAENYLRDFVVPAAGDRSGRWHGQRDAGGDGRAVAHLGHAVLHRDFRHRVLHRELQHRVPTFNQVFRLGSGEAMTPAAGYEVVTFNDPLAARLTPRCTRSAISAAFGSRDRSAGQHLQGQLGCGEGCSVTHLPGPHRRGGGSEDPRGGAQPRDDAQPVLDLWKRDLLSKRPSSILRGARVRFDPGAAVLSELYSKKVAGVRAVPEGARALVLRGRRRRAARHADRV